MKAVVYHGHEDMRVESVADPEIESDTDVLLQVERTAICGSDLHLWHGAEFPENGFVVGHEFLGTVEDVGPSVLGLKKGDRVLACCTTGCGHCASCRRGTYSGCPVTTQNFTAQNVFGFSNGLWGGQAEAVRVPYADANCVKVPDALSDDEVLFLTDILPTGYMAADLARVGPGDTVVVFGCGPVGTFAQMSAMVRGAAQVIAVDVDGGRLGRAAARGCVTIDSSQDSAIEQVMARTNGLGADVAIEAVGKPELVTQAAMVTRPGGAVSVVGVILEPFQIEWALFFGKNLSLYTGLVSPQQYIPVLMPLIEQGRLQPAEIISHRLTLDEAVKGYEIFANHAEDVLKVVLTP